MSNFTVGFGQKEDGSYYPIGVTDRPDQVLEWEDQDWVHRTGTVKMDVASELHKFIIESNLIEGITEEPDRCEVDAYRKFISGPLTSSSVLKLQAVIAPAEPLRSEVGMNVRVGDHVAPKGGDWVVKQFDDIITQAPRADPFTVHRRFLNLHPFIDGNGRTSRAIWLWMMIHQSRDWSLGFLHTFYYQTLSDGDRK